MSDKVLLDKETLGADGNPMGAAFVACEGSPFDPVIVPVGARGAEAEGVGWRMAVNNLALQEISETGLADRR